MNRARRHPAPGRATPGSPWAAAAMLAALAALSGAGCGGGFEEPALKTPYVPGPHNAPPPARSTQRSDSKHLYFGDLHIHTAFSYDAYAMGARNLPADAYHFAQGGTIAHELGYPIRMSRALDFAAVTDHAKFLGVPKHIAEQDGSDSRLARFRQAMENGNRLKVAWHTLRVSLWELGSRERRERHFGLPGYEKVSRNAWEHIIRAAEEHNHPGAFTTFIAYEWSSIPDDENLHRNVIYRSAHVPAFPFSALDSEDPRALWQALDTQRSQGMDALAIPHNGNLSNGRMYADAQFDGEPLTADYAAQRVRNEPISEIMQIKGQSETHPALSTEDEFANFEVISTQLKAASEASQPHGSYAREALRRGLSSMQREGFNPFQFGVIGASDNHSASTPAEESNYHGKMVIADGTASMRMGIAMWFGETMSQRIQQWGSAGLAAVWAPENTRDALFDALRARETYASSGPRISLRFFGGWDMPAGALDHPHGVQIAYRHGTPMGGALTLPTAKAPAFLIWASKDPQGANLDRAQIIKLWTDAQGGNHERVFDVAGAGRRRVGADGKLPPVGNTVDIADASYRNTIGGADIAARWVDPEFDPRAHAAYYVRVLEIPTPRWTTYDAKRLGLPAPQPATLQERAVSSAIWYRPGS